LATPFKEKVFIENKGQFNGESLNPQDKIEYAIDHINEKTFFSKKGVTYRLDEYEWTSVETNGESGLGKNDEEKEENTELSTISHYVKMQWIGSNPDVKIIGWEMTSANFNYAMHGKNSKPIYGAKGYQYIMYKDLYPNIDVKYEFHKTKGIKYSIILHPGADPSLIQMSYTEQNAISLDQNNNLHFNN